MSSVRAKTLLAVALASGGCVGAIGSDPAGGDPTDPAARDPSAADPSRTGADTPGGGKSESAGPWALERLTTREYDNTIRDLLFLPGYKGIVLPNDALGDSGFTSAGDVTALHAQTFLDAAEELAKTALETSPARLIPCTPAAVADEEPCAVKFIREFGKRAFRRPLGPDEVDDLTALYRQARADVGYGFRDAIGLLIQRFLQSASFLYHRERDGQPVREGALVRLGPYEVASRLSYLLWGTMPDVALLTAADAGQLSTAAEVSAHAARMLADRRARPSLTSFHEQWLGMEGVGHLEKDASLFPNFATEIQPSMEAELSAFVDYVFKGDARLETLLTAPVAFATPASAKVYGLPAAKIGALKPGVSKIDLDPTRRAGLLTQIAFLAANAKGAASHPVARGLAVWRRLLCGETPAPPPNVPEPRAAAPNLSTRERFAEHDRNPCANCHKVFDPPGFAFEHYDAIGGYRTTDGGKPVDSTGTFALPDTGPVSFTDAVGLMQTLATTREARNCVTRQWFRYALGRKESAADEGSIEATFSRAGGASSLDLKQLVMAIVQSRAFLLRAPNPGEAP